MKIKYGPYSSSRFNTAVCPYRFKRQYIDKDIKDTSSNASRRGNVVHETFEKITEGLIRDKPLTWPEVETILTDKMISYRITERESRELCVTSSKMYMERPPELLESLYGIEEQLGAKLNKEGKWIECSFSDPDAIYRGKIDLLFIKDDTARIVDHKTQPYVEKNPGTEQMGGYAWLVSLHFPQVKRVETILHYCRVEIYHYSKPVVWTKEDLKNIEQGIKMKIGTIENMETFQTDPSAHCVYCPIQLNCDELLNLKEHATKLGKLKDGPLMTAQEAVLAAKELQVVELATKIVKTRLQEFVKQVGPVHIAGKEFTFVASHTYEVKKSEDKQDLISLLTNFGLDSHAFVNINTTALKKLWKTLLPNQLEDIKKFLTPVTKTSFRGRKT